MLDHKLNLVETFRRLRHVELTPESRFWFGSPCRFIRYLDISVHIVIPELIENSLPRLSKYLRRTSPRWGRSWRNW
jgi:hypothetical protein